MRNIKNMVVICFLLSAGLAVMLAVSLRGEREYLKNCQALGIECQSGNVHQATEYVVDWVRKTWQKFNEKLDGQPVEEAGIQNMSGQ